MASAVLSFGPFELRPGERRLLRGGVEVPLGPRAFDLLCGLVAKPGELLTKDELLSNVWRGLVVEEANLHVQVSQLRKAIGAEAVATVPGLGYRFALPVESAAPSAATRRLSVVVIPFVEPGAPPGQDYFADGITEAITGQLSRIRGSFVMAAPSALALKGAPVDLPRIARELGIRYALQGRIERDEQGVEVGARLSDTRTGGVIWSDTLQLPRGSVRQIRHEIVARLATALDIQLLHAEAQRSASENTPADAVDLVMQGRDAGVWNWSREHYERAMVLFERALAIAPDDPEALARRAWAHAVQAAAWPGPRIEWQLAQAQSDALRALQLDSMNPIAHVALAKVRYQQYRLDEAAAAAEAALELDPNFVPALDDRAEVHRLCGRAELGIPLERRALELSPLDPHRWVLQMRLGWLHFNLGEYESALYWLERSHDLHPHWVTTTGMAALHAQLGDLDRARALAAQRQQNPEVPVFTQWNRVGNHPVFLRQLQEHFFPGLVKAGFWPDMSLAEAWMARQRRGGVP